MEVVSGKSVQLSLDELNLNSSVVDMTVGDGRLSCLLLVMEDSLEEVLKMKSWVTTSSLSEVVDYEIVNHTSSVQVEGCLREVCPTLFRRPQSELKCGCHTSCW
ncbi:unnamed protein product [Cyberlindnera jadinii]|uniref:Uncharacterized protein n=1 Tax=Cyberlindnera jadinii (strain ATCC 18201 / CBS 1600 / BCRC 20928 / JCM 3617 / NBRC 0987 / NRRL Y-1542) TaxID=983966 RepID=A0A0H5C2B4_CYBJN|nr:unnamed protein product [Cyberlindnera jadinii]